MALGPIVAPVLRSMTSKVVPLSERGEFSHFTYLNPVSGYFPYLLTLPQYNKINNYGLV